MMGGIIMDIRRDLIEKGKEINMEEEGVAGEEKWRIVEVYVSKGLDVAKSSLEKWTDKEGKELILLGGDFNARTGMRGGGCKREEGEVRIRRSKKLMGREGS